MTADVESLAGGKEHVFRRLIEDVVHDLDGVDEAGVERLQHVLGFPAVDADAEAFDHVPAA